MKKIAILLTTLFALATFTTSSVQATITNLTRDEVRDHLKAAETQGEFSLDSTKFYANDLNYIYTIAALGECWIKTDDPKCVKNTAVGETMGGIAYMYTNKPVKTVDYVAYYRNKISPVKDAYAQGIGFAGLSPLLNIWKTFRNIAYGFIIIVMVIIGFMVLFRAKIDPRTVISVQSAVPRIIVTLLLIAFSFAIVGLLIDLMYLVMFVVITALTSSIGGNIGVTISNYTGGSLANLWGAVFTPSTEAVNDIVNVIGKGTVDAIGGIITGATGAFLLRDKGIGGLIVGAVGGYVAGSQLGTANLLILLLVWLSLFFTLIRILFTIVNAYIQVIVSTIFGPLQLMFDAIPNTNAFGNWIRGLIANLAVFPTVMLLLLLGQILTAYAQTENLWRAPGLGGNFQAGVSGIIGLGLMFMIPNIAGSIKELLKAKPLIPSGSGALFSPLTSVWGTSTNLLSQMYYFQMLSGENGLFSRFLGGGGGSAKR